MSSTLRHHAQIAPRIGYFIALSSTDTEGGELVDAPALDLSGATTLTSLNTFVNSADMATYFTQNSAIGQGQLLKDLGQEIIIVDDSSNYVARYRNVLVVNGPGSEGIAASQTANVLVRVWAANGSGVVVSRTG
jgi:hypothetical protein